MKILKFQNGDKIGNLTVLEFSGINAHGDKMYKCQCSCGNECYRRGTVLQTALNRDSKASCGCLWGGVKYGIYKKKTI